MKKILPLSKKAKSLKLGVYKHYKGNMYQVFGIARHSETLEEMVIYQKLYDDYGWWVRPLSMFFETVKIGEKKVLRFQYLGH